MNIRFVSYDGEYPNLCSGTLILEIDGHEIKFPAYCLSSGGSVTFSDDWDECVASGPWSIPDWPDVPLTEEAKKLCKDLVNENVPFGCCGGCL